MNRNCPNCGAPYDTQLNTCPYCSTSYFDMSCIDFEKHKPIYLKLKMNYGGQTCYVTQKVIPVLGGITIDNETQDIVDYSGNVVKKIYVNRHAVTNISFEAIYDADRESLYQVEVRDA